MIDTKELRQPAQDATPHVGHACKYQDAHWLREGHVDFENADLFIASERPREDAAFYAAANPSAVIELLDRLEAAEKEIESWKGVAKQFGNDADTLRTHLSFAKDELNRSRAKIAEMEKQEPVVSVWRCDNGHIGGSCEKTLPMGAKLYALPGAKGEEK